MEEFKDDINLGESVVKVLKSIYGVFVTIRTIFLGNLPTHVANFF